MPLALFRLGLAVSLTIAALGLLLVALVGFVLCTGARPGWAQALRRRDRSGTRCCARACRRGPPRTLAWFHVISSRVPALYDPDPSLPSSLQYAIPGIDVLWTAGRGGFALAAMAAAAALAWKSTFFRTPTGRALGLLALLVAMLPSSLHSPGEFAAEYVPGLLIALWLAVAAFGLLRDHAAALACSAARLRLTRGSRLLSQPAPRSDRRRLRLVCWRSGGRLLGGRRDRTVAEPPPPVPVPTTPWSDSA